MKLLYATENASKICNMRYRLTGYDIEIITPKDIGIHIEVDEDMTMARLDQLQREILYAVVQETGVLLEGIGIYCHNKKDSEADKLRKEFLAFCKKYEHVKQIHGFFIDTEKKFVFFDIVVSFEAPNRQKLFDEIVSALKAEYPEYSFNLNLDIDLSD